MSLPDSYRNACSSSRNSDIDANESCGYLQRNNCRRYTGRVNVLFESLNIRSIYLSQFLIKKFAVSLSLSLLREYYLRTTILKVIS